MRRSCAGIHLVLLLSCVVIVIVIVLSRLLCGCDWCQAKVALRKGADINVKNLKGNTPLHFCFQYGYGESLGAYLISKGADATARNRAGYTCYEMGE